jgi:hypothetical protein
MMQNAPASCAALRRSPKSGMEITSTVTISMCDAANAGPTGARSSSVIHMMNAPM